MPSGDLQLGFVQGNAFDKHLEFRLGRQNVIGGAAQVLPIDGLDVTFMPFKSIGITAYAGALVIPRFATASGDVAAGTRIFWKPTFETEVGMSFVDVLDHGLTARQELGFDARYVPWRWLTLTGYALVSTLEWRLAEARPHHRHLATQLESPDHRRLPAHGAGPLHLGDLDLLGIRRGAAGRDRSVGVLPRGQVAELRWKPPAQAIDTEGGAGAIPPSSGQTFT